MTSTPSGGNGSPGGEPSDLSRSWLVDVRSRLSQRLPRRMPPSDTIQAAVLIPLYVDAGQIWTVLTRRTEHLPSHKGQVAFPGGKLEPGEDVWDGALREAREEIGLDPTKVLRLGQLDESGTPSGFRIVPCVGAVPYPMQTEINAGEIDEVFSVPLSALANPDLVEDRHVLIDDRERVMRIYHVGRHQIWGLTSRIIQALLQRLGLEVVPLEE